MIIWPRPRLFVRPEEVARPLQGPQLRQAPGITDSALARVGGSEWRKRIPAYTAGPRQVHRAPGLAGADRTQKVGSRRPKTRQVHRAPGLAAADRTQKVGIRRPKNRYWGPLALRRIAKSPARVSGAEWRKRISAHKSAISQSVDCVTQLCQSTVSVHCVGRLCHATVSGD
eukprot:gene15969-biopygen20233